MSNSYLGSKVSLISKSNIRYEGILYSIDTKESTIALSKVRFCGTESRVPDKFVPPRDDVYDYIIFRACDIRDLIVMEPPEAINDGLDDPAIVQAHLFSTSGDSDFKNKPAAPESNAYQVGAAAAVPQQTAVPKSFGGSNPSLAGNVSEGMFNGHQPSQVPTGPPPTTGPAFGFRSTGSSSPASHSPVPDQPKQEQPANNIGGASSSSASNSVLNAQQSAQSGSQQHQQSSQPPHHQGNRRNWQESHQFANNNGHHQGLNNHNNQDRRPRVYPLNQQNRRQPGGFNPHHHHQGNPNQFNQRNNPMPMFRRHPGGPMQPNGMPRPRSQQPMMRNGLHPMRPNQFNPAVASGNVSNNPRGGPVGRKFDPALKTDFDFEKANQEFQELETKLSKLIVNDKENEQSVVEVEEPKKPEEEKSLDDDFYNKKKSFFDKISCEALERSKGNVTKVDWKQERKLNVETFGMQFNFRRNNYNTGYRPRPNYGGGGQRNHNNNAGNNSRFRSNSTNNGGNAPRVNA